MSLMRQVTAGQKSKVILGTALTWSHSWWARSQKVMRVKARSDCHFCTTLAFALLTLLAQQEWPQFHTAPSHFLFRDLMWPPAWIFLKTVPWHGQEKYTASVVAVTLQQWAFTWGLDVVNTLAHCVSLFWVSFILSVSYAANNCSVLKHVCIKAESENKSLTLCCSKHGRGFHDQSQKPCPQTVPSRLSSLLKEGARWWSVSVPWPAACPVFLKHKKNSSDAFQEANHHTKNWEHKVGQYAGILKKQSDKSFLDGYDVWHNFRDGISIISMFMF